MKRSVFPLLILSLALIFPALTGCPQETGGDNIPSDGPEGDTAPDNIPSGNLGDGPLVLKGKVYRETIDQEGFTVTYELDTAPRVVEVYAGGEKLDEWPLADGEFNTSIAQPANLSSASADALAEMFPGWSSPKAEPADVRGIVLNFRLQGGGGSIYQGEGKVSGDQAEFSFAFEVVTYLYVDKDVVITLGERKIPEAFLTYKAAKLELKKGWNALFYDQSGSGSGSLTAPNDGSAANWSISVGNPDLKWTIYFYND